MGIICGMDICGKRVHFIGVCGVSLSALAVLALGMGAKVSGSDLLGEEKAQWLREKGVTVFVGHSWANVVGADVVIYSSAIGEDNPELVYARKTGIKILKRAEFLGEIAKGYEIVVAVAGSHGKTTTTAMISKILIDNGLDPTVHIGGEYSFIGGNVRIGGRKIFVTEACEYKNNFLHIEPSISVVLNVEPDHLDFFKSFERVKNGFYRFIKNTSGKGITIVNVDDKNIVVPLSKNRLTFSLENKGDICAVNLELHDDGTYSFDYLIDGWVGGRVKLAVCGKHNIYNALASMLVGEALGIPFDKIAKSLSEFGGVDRRFQLVGKINGANVIIDYAHHPTEIKASIETSKTWTKGKVVAVFQPHTYSRTQSFFDEFVDSLSWADESAFFTIYPAREREILGVSHLALARAGQERGLSCVAIDDYSDLIDYINNFVQPGNTILLLGAGDFVKVVDKLDFD